MSAAIERKANPSAAPPNHNPVLDGIRGIAIVMVIFCHYFAWSTKGDFLARACKTVASLGGTGVDLFFTLSGFLITGILIDRNHGPHFLRNFYMRRILRIFPLYYGFLFVTFIALPALSLASSVPLVTQLWYWTYIPNIGMTFVTQGLGGPFHFWSLGVEEHFYLVWPLLITFVKASNLQRVLWGIVLVSLMSRCLLLFLGFGVGFFTLCRLDALAMGSMLAIATRSTPDKPKLRLIAIRLLLIVVPIFTLLYRHYSGASLNWIQVLKYSIVALGWTCFLSIALSCQRASVMYGVLSSRVLTSMGKYSYGMYVFHLAVLDAYSRIVHEPISVWGFLLATATIYIIAAACWHVWEQPFLNLKVKFQYGS